MSQSHCLFGQSAPFLATFGQIATLYLAKSGIFYTLITRESSWIVPGTENTKEMQIDLVIDRDDRKICLCEMKFRQGEFSVDNEYAARIQDRINRTMEITHNNKPVISVLITTYGLHRNEYAGKFQKVITMEDLFR